jgi:tRNA threonylcarbamoyladenosine biosynthesis protein TsaB
MVVLGIDTATSVLAVGLGNENELLGSSSFLVPRGHSRLLQPTIASVLQSAGSSMREVQRLAVGVGPGSYTGVRLGVTTAKAMALALGIPVAPISTLHALADAALPYRTSHETWVVPLLYARRQRAFGAIYAKVGNVWRTITEQKVLPVSDWVDVLSWAQTNHGTAQPVYVIHDFLPKYEVLQWLESPCIHATGALQSVAGGLGPAIVRLACRPDASLIEGAEVHGLVPDYALQVEAEVKFAERGQL